MLTHLKTFIRTVRTLILRSLDRRRLIATLLATIVLFATESHALVTVNRTSGPVLFTDSSIGPPSPLCGYVSFTISNPTAINDAWVTIGGFTGGYLSLATHEDGIFHLGSLAASETRPVYFYVCSSFTTNNTDPAQAQTYDIKVYNGNPSAGGAQIPPSTTPTVSTQIINTTVQAAQNSVNLIISGPNPPALGGIVTMTVDGDTGTMGCINPPSVCSGSQGGPLAFSPASYDSWRADAYELIGSNITLSISNFGSYDNTLYLDPLTDSGNTHYLASYYFRAVGTTTTPTTLSPIAYIASGGKMKHTTMTGGAYQSGNITPIQSAQLSVLLTKAVSHATLPAQGGRVTYTVTATNSGQDNTTFDSFVDVLPSGASYVAGSTTFNGATIPDPGISGQTLTWSSSFLIPAGGTRNLVFQVDLPATPGTYTNAVTARIGTAAPNWIIVDSTLQTTDNVPATATTVVLKAPTITKSISPTSLAVNGTATMTLTLANPNVSTALTGVVISDSLPSSPLGLGFAVPSGAATTCSGATLSVIGTTIGVTGGTLAAGQSCTITANVTSASANTTYTNTTGTVSSTNGGIGGTASAAVTFTSKPTITKSFSVPTIPQNGTAVMSITITSNSNVALTGLTFDDLFPSGLLTANPPAVTPAAPCGGTLSSWNGVSAGALSPTGGSPGIRLTGGAIAIPGGTCTFTINVTAATAGMYSNTTGGVNSNETSPAGPASNTATLSVLSGPSVAKAFSSSTIGKGQNSTLIITLTNNNASDITGTAFTDTYPANVTTAAAPNTSTTCPLGAVNSTSGSISLSGGTIPANGSCTVSIDVTSNVVNNPGYVNTIGAGAVTTTNAGSNAAAASATLIVNATPTISKSFSFNTSTGVSTMTITITNNHTAGISGLSFTDFFPGGMWTANPPAISPATPCGAGSTLQSWDGTTAGTLSGTGGDAGIKLTAGQILAGGGSCTFSINLSVNSLGVYANQTSGVTLTTPFTGTGSPSNSAAWIAPAISKSFTPNTVGPGDISRMEIRITNPSLTTPLTGLAITDTYPTTATLPSGSTITAAITNSATPNAPPACGGTVTAAANGTGITMTGGSLPAGGACTIAVDVHAVNTTPATYYNTTSSVASNQGIGSTGSDALYIVTKPTVTKSFLTSPVTLSGGTATSVMRLIIENNAGANITAVSLTDNFPSLPSQMKWVNTVANSCGGLLTDAAGAALVTNNSTGIKLTNGAITAAAGTCTIDITVSVPATGSYNNTTSGVTSSANPSPGPQSNAATLTAYLSPPSITKTFAKSAFVTGDTNRLTITLNNPNTADITGVTFTDSYPANLFNAAISNLVSTCGGTATAAPGSSTLSLTGGTIPASGSCSISVDVTTTVAGSYTNTLNINAVTSTNANPGPAVALSANSTAYPPATLAKAFSPTTIVVGSTTTITFTINNGSGNPAQTGLSFTDTLTAGSGLTVNSVTALSGAGCSPTIPSFNATSNPSITLAGAGMTAGSPTCTFTATVQANAPGTYTNTSAGNISAASSSVDTSSASSTLTVQSQPLLVIVKSANPGSAKPGEIITYTVQVSNSGGPATSVNLTDMISPYTALRLKFNGTDATPFEFTDNSPPNASGLTVGTISYSSNNGADLYTYIPTDQGGGFNGNVTNWKIIMNNTMNQGSSGFTLRYQMKVK